MNLAFVILAHDFPDQVARLVDRLTAQGGTVALHWDSRHPVDLSRRLRETLPAAQAARVIAAERIEVHWGLWSVVQATLNALEALQRSGLPVDYVTLLSGHDYPLRPLSQLAEFLHRNGGIEHIESVDHEKEKWITDGLHDERWQYRHYVSWGTHPKTFDKCWHLQHALGLKKRPPTGIKPHFGSQWWTLSWPTLQAILQTARRQDVRNFFRRTWVPDEMFFQTLLAAAAPRANLSGTCLTLYHFARNGVPLVFYEDHYELLAAQPFFFARKISPWSDRLRDKLDALARSRNEEPTRDLVIRKNFAAADYFYSRNGLHLNDAKVFGRQRDPLWADMSANKTPYSVIVGGAETDFTSVLNKIAADRQAVVFGELFQPGKIDYGHLAAPHPLYPSSAPALRDQNRPNFLYDLIHSNLSKKVILCLRVPRDGDIAALAAVDPLCEMIFVTSGRNTSESEIRLWADTAERYQGRLAKIRWFTSPETHLKEASFRARDNTDSCSTTPDSCALEPQSLNS
jgi:hypothetical protein